MRISSEFETNRALFAILRHPQTRLIFKAEAPGEIMIEIILSPSVERITPCSMRSDFEVLLKNLIFPSAGNPVGQDE